MPAMEPPHGRFERRRRPRSHLRRTSKGVVEVNKGITYEDDSLIDKRSKKGRVVASALHAMNAELFESPQEKSGDPQPVLEFEPRIKDDGNGGEVDIANTRYRDLPPKWQAENKAAAEGAVDAVLRSTNEGVSLRDAVEDPRRRDALIEQSSNLIHENWLSRNGEWAPEEQKLPYAELSEEEKEKDRVLARKAVDVILSAQRESVENGGTVGGVLRGKTAEFASDLHDEWRETRRVLPAP